jgi:AhpD family alkylhydroperoxidase
MDAKTEELIAVGVSAGAHCQPCLTYHVATARELGINESDIRDAVTIGHNVEKGAMSAMRRFAAQILENVAADAPACCGSDAKGKAGVVAPETQRSEVRNEQDET